MDTIKAGIEEAAKRKMLKLSSIPDLHKFGASNLRSHKAAGRAERIALTKQVRKTQKEDGADGGDRTRMT